MFTLVPNRILVAPSGVKESLSAVEVADAISAGLRRALPGLRVDSFPVPDGGEGTVEILSKRADARTQRSRVTGPVKQQVTATWVLLDDGNTAVIEMASAAGLSLVPKDSRNPAKTTTVGVGELIVAALDAGAHKIIVGCGDSGTTDGGAGALAALGMRFFDEADNLIELPDGDDLNRIGRIDSSQLDQRLANTRIELACNTHNVLTGPSGVARVFGPQKGATPEQILHLEAGLDNLARLLDEHFTPEFDIFTGPGSGASGGLGAGLAAIGALPRDRFEVLLDDRLDELVATADLVITAEGAIDFQTPNGKVPAEIARRAQATGVPVIALAGSLGSGAPQVHDVGIGAIASIMTIPMELETAVRDSYLLLADAAERTMRLVIVGSAMAGRIRAQMQ